jgi:tetratricopeptide (TPR) repeat protein
MRKYLAVLFGAIVLLSFNAWGQGRYSSQQANSYIVAHDGNGAVRYAIAWTKAEADNFYAWAALGTAYGVGLHQPADAISAFKRALAIRTDSAECLNAIGAEYINMKNYSEAADFFKRAAEKAQAKPNYWNNLASAYSDQNKRDLALEALDNGQKLAGPTDGYGDWYNLGNGFYNLKDYSKALFAFQRSVRLNPRFGNAWNNLGTAQQQVGNASEALRDYKQAGALGDSLGNQNYTMLNNAIIAAQERARNAGKSLTGVDAIVAHQMAQFTYDHTLHDPINPPVRP